MILSAVLFSLSGWFVLQTMGEHCILSYFCHVTHQVYMKEHITIQMCKNGKMVYVFRQKNDGTRILKMLIGVCGHSSPL